MPGDNDEPEHTLESLTKMFYQHKEVTEKKLKDGDDFMHGLSETVHKLNANLEDFLELWEAGEGFVKVVKKIGAFFKWLAITGAAVGVVWGFIIYLIHGGHGHK